MDHQKHSVTITFSQVGIQPPVFVAGSFTDPPWQLVELDSVQKGKNSQPSASVEYEFHKTFEVEEGQWQYKLRIGTGDWWMCDPKAGTTNDAMGNRNNILVVHPGPSPSESKPMPMPISVRARPPDQTEVDPPKDVWNDSQLDWPRTEYHRQRYHPSGILMDGPADAAAQLDKPDSPHLEAAPVFAHERLSVDDEAGGIVPNITGESLPKHEKMPLLSHELPSPPPEQTDSFQLKSKRASDEGNGEAPLFPHECSPPATPPDQLALGGYSPTSRRKGSIVLPVVEHFPSSREEILNTIEDTIDSLDEDVTIEPQSPDSHLLAGEREQRPSASVISDRSSILGSIAEELSEEEPQDTPDVGKSDADLKIDANFDGANEFDGATGLKLQTPCFNEQSTLETDDQDSSEPPDYVDKNDIILEPSDVDKNDVMEPPDVDKNDVMEPLDVDKKNITFSDDNAEVESFWLRFRKLLWQRRGPTIIALTATLVLIPAVALYSKT